MEVKFLLGILAAALAIAAYVPYLRSVFSGRTKPHIYTWLIWTLTTGTAAVATWYGGGNFGSLSLFAGSALAFAVFLLSFRYGTTDITKGDTATLIAALLAILLWWQMQNPLLAVFTVSAIDALGYLPTYRKLWNAPWSEDLRAWIVTAVGNLFALAALSEYNLLTVTYLAVLFTGNSLLIILSMARRRKIRSP